ncbi:hypothetical protein ACFOWM_10750 [Ferruginibacter yonginensis]|uniref:Uncharacterized protein n=1 Tax=Ferruginibacter yonginensis TaxID=1310416 RepID=A0ABV8QSX8_9BACT
MLELSDHIIQLQQKLQVLLKQYHTLLQQNSAQQQLIQTLQQQQQQQLQQIETLQQQQLVLKAAVDDLNDPEKKQLELQINRYIKTIDQCIALLSHQNNI